MVRPVDADSLEARVGMECFGTDTEPAGGRLRVWAEDFAVEEIGGRPRPADKGRHLAVRMRLLNWEQNHFIRDASRAVRCSREAIGFCGTKDKRALTTQWFSFYTRRDDTDVLDRLASMSRVDVLEHTRAEKGLRLGMHEGNRFAVILRGLDGDLDTARERVTGTIEQIRNLGGIPNYFGIQRFGADRPITHTIGKHLLAGDLEGAVMAYLAATEDDHVEHGASEESTDTPRDTSEPRATPDDHEDDDALSVTEARHLMGTTRDWKGLQDKIPHALRFERSMVQHLAADPDDWQGALKQLPHNLRSLFIHAYQSYLFNRILSERLRQGRPLNEPRPGDLVLPLTDHNVPHDASVIPVTNGNLEAVTKQVRLGRAAVTAPLIGHDTPRGHGDPEDIVAHILEQVGVNVDHFRMPTFPEIASPGTLRPLLVPAWDLDAQVVDGTDPSIQHAVPPDSGEWTPPEPVDGPAAILRFALPKGSYATGVLRELMKSRDVRAY